MGDEKGMVILLDMGGEHGDNDWHVRRPGHHLDGVLGEHGAVELHGRQGELLGAGVRGTANSPSPNTLKKYIYIFLAKLIYLKSNDQTLAMSLFLILAASSSCLPLIHSVARLGVRLAPAPALACPLEGQNALFYLYSSKLAVTMGKDAKSIKK